jgi:MoaA/NifB/PqqE/SkfB family radical SAM enzyme
MKLADWKRLLADSYEAGCRNVQFIGGEPTVYPHLIELIQYSRTLGYELVEVFTNGTVFTERLKEAFTQFRVNLAFSVYADNSSVHDSITLRAGSFSKTVQSIKWALENGLEVRVAIVEMKENSPAIEATRKLFEDLGVAEVRIDRIRGVGRGSTAQGISSEFDELCGNCWKGKLCVAPTGDMYPCVFSRSWLVGTAAEGIKAALEGRRLVDFRSTLRSKLQSDPTNCIPARDDAPACGPDQRCNPGRGMDALQQRSRKPCGPRKREPCAP